MGGDVLPGAMGSTPSHLIGINVCQLKRPDIRMQSSQLPETDYSQTRRSPYTTLRNYSWTSTSGTLFLF